MSATISQCLQELPYIGTAAHTTTLCTVSKGALLQYKRSRSTNYGIVKGFKHLGNTLHYIVYKAELYTTFIAEYQSEQGLAGAFQVKRKSSAKLLEELDTSRCILISVKELHVRCSMVQAVGVVYDAGQYKKMSKSVQPSPWVFWNHFEIDDDRDLCCIGKNDTALYSYSGLRSGIHQAASLEVRAAASAC
jgi:hypothetical protein